MIKSLAGKRDPFAATDQELAFRAAMYDAWQSQLSNATRMLSQHIAQHTFFQPSASEVPSILHALSVNLSGPAIASAVRHAATQHLAQTIAIGKQSVDKMFHRQTGRDPMQKDLTGFSGASFGVMFGMTEDHALQALIDQVTIAAGGFWDTSMSESVRNEIMQWFNGELTREEFVNKLKALVNTRLSIEGRESLPGSYFDGLAEHYVVRARNVGSVYRAKALGASKYRIVNPRDDRTSEICSALSAPGKVFTMAGAESRVADILGARSQDDLKAAAPFLTAGTVNDETSPVPPLHWRCRSWMSYVFEGL